MSIFVLVQITVTFVILYDLKLETNTARIVL